MEIFRTDHLLTALAVELLGCGLVTSTQLRHSSVSRDGLERRPLHNKLALGRASRWTRKGHHTRGTGRCRQTPCTAHTYDANPVVVVLQVTASLVLGVLQVTAPLVLAV